jgi:hypothetical protein
MSSPSLLEGMSIPIRKGRPVQRGAAAIAFTGLTAGLVFGVGASANAAHPATAQFTAPPDGFVLTHTFSMDAAEQATAECMAEAGWDYVPFLHDVEVYSAIGADGIPGEASAESPQLLDLVGSADDPNEAIVDALSPSERRDYNRALYGGQVLLDGQGRLAGQDLASTEEACR